MAERLQAMGQPRYVNGFEVTLQEDVVETPLRWRLPRIIFVNSMSDLFHKDVPSEFIHRCFAVMNRASQHTFQVLTKRPERVVAMSDELTWSRNIWIGASVENAAYAWRATEVAKVAAARVRFLSIEPLLGPIPRLPLRGIDWVIVGGESGPGARPMSEEWVVEVREQCERQGIPFFFKQWGGVQKSKAGRRLEGREWNGMPYTAGGWMAKKRDRWPELCKLVEADDGLPVRDVGKWTEDKLIFWNRYVDITTSAMVGNPKWPGGLGYVDLFGGPGVCRLEKSGRRIPGSALIAANAPKPFRFILVSELSREAATALEARLKRTSAANSARVFQGDCNLRIAEMASLIPAKALTLAFIDPEGLHVRFETIQALAARGRVDLLILFADYMDIVRNVDRYEKQVDSNLDRMMGPESIWRDEWKGLFNRSRENICKLFAKEYCRQLQRILGYKVFAEEVMKSANGPLYRLIFASKHERGLEFWNKITKKSADGQLGLFGG
jgi:three-Cys-motif partner protein